MRIIILGANGFTGRRILKRLSPNHQVMACSLRPDILPEEGSMETETEVSQWKEKDDCIISF